MEDVDLLMGMGNGDSRLNIVMTKSLQSANKVLTKYYGRVYLASSKSQHSS